MSAGSKSRERHSALLQGLSDMAEAHPPMGRAGPDGAVPAIAMAGSLMKEELQIQRDRVADLEQQLRDALAQGSERDIDPALIRHSRFRDRHELGFQDEAFDALKASIEHDGGNHQAILVRPLEGDTDGAQFEVVWGHRRHRACLLAGLRVKALVRDLSDRDAVLLMSSENSQRKDLSQFEQARKYRSWLAAGLFANQLEIAEAEGVNKATISRYMAINDLPDVIVERVADPRTITGLWAAKVMQLVERNRAEVLATLKDLPAGETHTIKALMKQLQPDSKAPPKEFSVGGEPVFQAVAEKGGGGQSAWKSLRLHRELDETQLAKLAEFVKTL